MIVVSICGVMTGCYWLYARVKIQNRIRKKVVVTLAIDSSVNSVVAIAQARRYPLKRYRLLAFHEKEYLWSINHFAKALMYLFDRRGTFLLNEKEAAGLSLLVPLSKAEKNLIFDSISSQLQEYFSEQKLADMVHESLLVKDSSGDLFAFEYLENILEAQKPLRDIDTILLIAN